MIRAFLAKFNPRNYKIKQRLLHTQKAIEKPRSVIFFTTHKCASSFMNQFFLLLSNDSEYEVVDYASSIWALGDSLDVGAIYEPFLENNYDHLYFQTGEIYAPQRRPIDFPGIEKFKHIYFLRDPRDVLVSAYYSFGFSHSLPKNAVAKEVFLKEREKMQAGSIDDYVKAAAIEWVLPVYKKYQALRTASSSNIFLSYDLFNSDLSKFIQELTQFLDFDLSEEKIQEVVHLNKQGVATKEDISKHRRSGKSGQFREKLSAETIDFLNKELIDILNYWNFKV